MRCTLILATLAVSTGAPAQMYGNDFESCSQSSTVEIVACLQRRAQAWDARLNQAYKEAMARVDAPQREPLRAAQRLWIQYRDANCRAYGSREGSIRQIEAAECVRAMTQARAEELAEMGAG